MESEEKDNAEAQRAQRFAEKRKKKPHPENRRVRHPLVDPNALEPRRKLLCGFGFGLVEGEGEAGFVAVGGVFVEHAFGNRLIDRGKRGIQKIGGRGDVTGGKGGAETAHGGANARAIGAIDFGALARLCRAL